MANEVVITVRGDDKASNVMDGVERKARSVGSSMGSALKVGAVAATGALVGGAIAAKGFVEKASNLNETLSKVGVVFGKNADDIKKWASTAASSMGQSQRQALEAAGTFGNLFDALGLNETQTKDMSKSVVQLAADLSSFNNIGSDEALEKLRAGLVGEAEPLRSLGVNINEATVKAKAMQMGLGAVGRELTDAEKVQARYALILEQTTNAQGDFARTSDGLANQQRILGASWENIQATLGNALLPTINLVTKALAKLLTEHEDDIQRFADAFAKKIPEAIVAVVNAIQQVRPQLEYVFQQMKEGFEVIKPGLQWIIDNKPALVAALTAIGVAMLLAFSPVTVPILAVVAAIGALLFILGTSKEEWKKYGEAVNQVWEDLQAAIEEKLGIIGTVINAFMDVTRNNFVTGFKVIRDIVVIVLALIHGDWGRAWEGIRQLAHDILDGIVTDFKIKFGLMRDVALWAFETIKAIVGNALSGLRDVVAYAIGAVLNFFYGLPQQIKDAIGDVSSLLYDIGADILSSLWDGMKDKWEDVSGWVGGLGGKIKDLKGPIDQDRVMLFDEGYAIISGLQNGMEAAAQNLFSYLNGLTARIASAVQQARAAVAAANTGDSGGDVNSDYGQREMGSQRPQRVGGRTRDEWKYIFGASGIPASEYNIRLREMFGYQQGALSTIGGPAMLHPREAVMPAEMADMLRELLAIFKSGGGMGSGGVTNYIDKIEMHGDPMTGLAALGASL